MEVDLAKKIANELKVKGELYPSYYTKLVNHLWITVLSTCLSLPIPLMMNVRLHTLSQLLTTMTKSVSWFLRQSGINKISDLNGKTIGVSQGASTKAALQEYASANNLKFNYVQLGSFPSWLFLFTLTV